jgi:hypothetical protein
VGATLRETDSFRAASRFLAALSHRAVCRSEREQGVRLASDAGALTVADQRSGAYSRGRQDRTLILARASAIVARLRGLLSQAVATRVMCLSTRTLRSYPERPA